MAKNLRAAVLVGMAWTFGCGSETTPDGPGTDADIDTDVDSDADSDADSDTDADTDGTDTYPEDWCSDGWFETESGNTAACQDLCELCEHEQHQCRECMRHCVCFNETRRVYQWLPPCDPAGRGDALDELAGRIEPTEDGETAIVACMSACEEPNEFCERLEVLTDDFLADAGCLEIWDCDETKACYEAADTCGWDWFWTWAWGG